MLIEVKIFYMPEYKKQGFPNDPKSVTTWANAADLKKFFMIPPLVLIEFFTLKRWFS